MVIPPDSETHPNTPTNKRGVCLGNDALKVIGFSELSENLKIKSAGRKNDTQYTVMCNNCCIPENRTEPFLIPNRVIAFVKKELKKGSVSEKAICKSKAIATVFTALSHPLFELP